MSAAQNAQRSSYFIIQLITLISWLALALCIIQMYFLIEEKKDFIRGVSGFAHKDNEWNNLIKFYGGIGLVSFGIATGLGLKVIASGLIVLYIITGLGKEFYMEGQRNNFSASTLPMVGGALPTTRPAAKQAAARTPAQWTAIAKQKGMKVTRHLQPKEVSWCGNAGRALNWREQLNCATRRVWKY